MMKPHKHAERMKEYAEDAAKTDKPWLLWECRERGKNSDWYGLCDHPIWNLAMEYRRKDPYAELKEAQAAGKVIQFHSMGACWLDCTDDVEPSWSYPPERYRVKPEPTTKKVKLLAWWDGDQLFKLKEGTRPKWGATRQPHLDEEIEIEVE